MKVDVHFNNGVLDRPSNENGYTNKSEMGQEPSEHAYEQICLRQDSDTGGIVSSSQKKLDNTSDRRYIRYMLCLPVRDTHSLQADIEKSSRIIDDAIKTIINFVITIFRYICF